MALFKLLKHLSVKGWIFMAVSVVLIVLQVWCEILMPEYLGNLSKIISSGEIIKIEDVLFNGGMMILFASLSLLASLVFRFFITSLSADFSAKLREELFKKILLLGPQEFNELTTASLITRTTLDITQVQFLFSLGLHVIVKSPVMAIWAICRISSTHIEWTMAVLAVVLVILTSLIFVTIMVFPRFKKVQKLTDELNGTVRETITGVRVIRAFNAESFHAEKIEDVNDRITKNNLFINRTISSLMPIITLGMNVMVVALYWIAAILMKNASIPERGILIGNLTTFIQYAMNIVTAFMMLVAIFIFLPRAMVSVRRINEVFETNPKVVFPSVGINKEIDGNIEFKDVTFTYPDGSSPCLKNISFKIKSGEKFAIIGATGSSKSTLIKLMLRSFDIDSGFIKYDGNDIKNFTLKELTKYISVAPQKAQLFMGTVKSNIIYGNEYDEERLKMAISIAQADFVYSLEKGIDSPVAQGGTNFSGGQKQRLSLARAIYKQAKVIIFDDTFSALDYKTDMLVRKGINQNLKETTTITISQRIGTIKNADQILVLEEGQIVGLGKHEDLLKTCPTYKDIALSQLDKEEL